MKTNATQRTLKFLKSQYKWVGIVERYIQRGQMPFGFRSDLFNIIDMICLDPDNERIIGIQSTSGGCRKDHYEKLTVECKEASRAWLLSGGVLQLISFSQKKKVRGGKVMEWVMRTDNITLENLNNE